MKYLIMTEGQCEKGILDAILDKGLLKYDIQDLVYEQIFHLRQIKDKEIVMLSQLPINEKVTIIRVGDKLTDALKIPREIKDRIEKIMEVCTKPELEMIYIIHKNKFEEYLKVKSKLKPSIYLSQIDPNYKKSYKYHYDYFKNMKKIDIKRLFKEYEEKRKGTHGKNQISLLDLIK